MLRKQAGAFAAIIALSALGLSACSPEHEGTGGLEDTTTDASVNADDGNDDYATNFIWHESDSFDPVSPLGTFVRAYIESMLRMSLDGGRSELFPGAEEATGFDLTSLERAAVDRPAGPEGRRGVQDLYVLAVNENHLESEVIVCEDPSGVAEKVADGKWEARGSEEFARVQISRLVLERVGDPPPSNVVGRAQSPSVSMFGGWKALEYQAVLTQDPLEEHFMSECLSEIGKDATPRDVGGLPVPEPPIAAPAPEPGWPEGESV